MVGDNGREQERVERWHHLAPDTRSRHLPRAHKIRSSALPSVSFTNKHGVQLLSAALLLPLAGCEHIQAQTVQTNVGERSFFAPQKQSMLTAAPAG